LHVVFLLAFVFNSKVTSKCIADVNPLQLYYVSVLFFAFFIFFFKHQFLID